MPPLIAAAPERLAGLAKLALLALILLCLFARLGAAPLFDVDEGAFSEASREMVVHHDYGRTTLNGEPRFDKPILVYWLQATSMRVFGVQVAAFRLPSVLCSLLWCASLIIFTARRWGERVAWVSGAIMASSLGVIGIGRAATADALLNALICLTMTDLWRYFEEYQASEKPDAPRSWALWRVFLWIGLGLLAKGPVALLIPAAVGLLYAVFSKRWASLLPLLRCWSGWLTLGLVALPWYIYAYLTQGQAFIDGFFIKHNLARYSGALEGHQGSLLYYLVLGPVMWLPWSGLLPRVLAQLRSTWAQPLGRFLCLWLGFVLVFFSFSGTKLPHYVLYGSSPMYLFLAQALVGPRDSRQASPSVILAWAWILPLTLLAALGLLPQLLQQLGLQSHDTLYHALLSSARDSAPRALLALPCLAILAAGLCLVRRRALFTHVLSAGLCALAVVLLVLPWLGQVLQEPIVEAAQVAKQRPEPAVQWDLHFPSFSVYREQETPRRAPHAGELALVRDDTLARHPCERCQTLFHQRGISLILRPATPDKTHSPSVPNQP